LNYARLKPDDIEGNSFMYHLRCLIKKGYIAHTDKWYQLTSEGQLYVDQVSLKTFTPPLQPKIVILIVAHNSAGETLFFKRNRHPLINKVGLPYGKLHSNESIYEAAARELRKKTGYEAEFEYHSSGTMRIFEQGELTSYILFLIVKATQLTGTMIDVASAGKPLWGRLDDLDTSDLIPSVHDVLKISEQTHSSNFEEIRYDL
jgi:ADP-ribose pyrophosphatase YjhB (NUDIX family)